MAPLPDNNNYVYPHKPSAGALQVAGTFFNAVQNSEVPTMQPDGKLYANIHTGSVATEGHNRLYLRTPDFKSNWWLHHGEEYQFDLTFELLDNTNWSTNKSPTTPSLTTAIPFQIEMRSDWAPVFALNLDRENYSELTLEINLRGTTLTTETWEYDNQTTVPINIGQHSCQVWWKKDETGADSYCKVVLDSVEVVEKSGVKLGAPFDANGNANPANINRVGGVPSLGVETPITGGFTDPGVEIRWSKCYLYKIT